MSSEQFDPHAYWDKRHQAYGHDLRDVGDKRISSAANSEQLVAKAAHLAWVMRKLGIDCDASLLDAGCGKGFLTEIFADVGFSCVGADVSDNAVQNSFAHSRVQYVVSPLEKLALGKNFRVIICADVLYHLVDDDLWSRAVSNLINHLTPNGVLLVVEAFDEVEGIAPHVKWRTLQQYVELTKSLGAPCRLQRQFTERHSKSLKSILAIERA